MKSTGAGGHFREMHLQPEGGTGEVPLAEHPGGISGGDGFRQHTPGLRPFGFLKVLPGFIGGVPLGGSRMKLQGAVHFQGQPVDDFGEVGTGTGDG